MISTRRSLVSTILVFNCLIVCYQAQFYNRQNIPGHGFTSDPFDTFPFPSGIAEKETSEPEVPSMSGNAVKETSSMSESGQELSSTLSELPPSSSSPSAIPSTETFTSQEKTTVYATVYEYPDATETATVTEIDTSYMFTFVPGDVSISTEAPNERSTITLTATLYANTLDGITSTPSASYSTQYVTSTITIEPLNELQSLTILTAVTTLTEVTTVTESTQATEIFTTTISDYYITETSTSIQMSLQTEALWIQKLPGSASTETLTMRSLDRFEPYYVTTSTIHSTVTQTDYITTTTPTSLQQQPATQQQQPTTQQQLPASITTQPHNNDKCAENPQMDRECLHIM